MYILGITEASVNLNLKFSHISIPFSHILKDICDWQGRLRRVKKKTTLKYGGNSGEGMRPWGRKESDLTEQLTHTHTHTYTHTQW